MSKKRSRVRTDPELNRQLKAENSDQGMVQAIFTLRLPSRRTVKPTRVEELTKEVLERVADEVGTKAEEINIFRHLGAFALSAPRPFIRALLSEPEIASATSNQQQESMMIPSQRKRPVT